uniref:Uncharacterized protein n=1 Tax=Romanomermis culicivorax TaxID=13658 RepID=A0A915IPW4_ROMCU
MSKATFTLHGMATGSATMANQTTLGKTDVKYDWLHVMWVYSQVSDYQEQKRKKVDEKKNENKRKQRQKRKPLDAASNLS